MTHQILEWIDSHALSENPEIKSRNLFANKNVADNADDIVKKYAYFSLVEIERLLSSILSDLNISLSGIGIELGAGVAGISNSVLSLYPAVEKIYAVEIVPDVVRLLQIKVTEHKGHGDRLIPVIGSFDDIKLPDSSVDFIIEYDSLHHSNDLEKTLREAARVLRPGGVLVALDRVHTNALTDAQREYMLNVEYGEPFKREYGIPVESVLTRRQNGEHEIRESEWRTAFERANLEIEHCLTFHRKCLRGLVLAFISQIPFRMRALHPKLQPRISRFPLAYFLLYVAQPLPFLWQKTVRPLRLNINNPSWLGKSAIVAYKNNQ